jgi:hypothetical protein
MGRPLTDLILVAIVLSSVYWPAATTAPARTRTLPPAHFDVRVWHQSGHAAQRSPAR